MLTVSQQKYDRNSTVILDDGYDPDRSQSFSQQH